METIRIQRAVKSNGLNPNNFYSEGLEPHIDSYINSDSNFVYMHNKKDIFDTNERLICSEKLLCGRIISKTDDDFEIELFDSEYKNNIINNPQKFRAQVTYTGELLETQRDFKNVYKVSKVIKIDLKEIGALL